MMLSEAMIDMKNKNALITMAHVSENADNPYFVFCEFIKYCIHKETSKEMQVDELRRSVGNELGINIPQNIINQCIQFLIDENAVSIINHKVKLIGEFDSDRFSSLQFQYMETERNVVLSLVDFAKKNKKDWSYDYAREQLLYVLDNDCLAFDILNGVKQNQIIDNDAVEEMELEDNQSSPLFTDRYIVGRFIHDLQEKDNIGFSYLRKVCEGLMICIGTYQLQSTNMSLLPQIKGTQFYFDTRLLLRALGCAGQAAVEGVNELIVMIQEGGGGIFYFPQTLEEMERAFDDALTSIEHGRIILDEEMRLFISNTKNAKTLLKVIRSTIREKLSEKKIYYRSLESYSDKDRITYGFPLIELETYMKSHLSWKLKTIENDALSIWEIHMRRRGNYRDYCGTSDCLPVFVTHNPRLISIILSFAKDNKSIKNISQWRPHRLPVITDLRLTCRLWNPSRQAERISLLRLTANVYAAQRPSPGYVKKITELVPQIDQFSPDLTTISISEYLDDQIKNRIFDRIDGNDDSMNLSLLVCTMEEALSLRLNESEEKMQEKEIENKSLKEDIDEERKDKRELIARIIDEAVEKNKNHIGFKNRIKLYACLHWEVIVSVMFCIISTVVGIITNDWNVFWLILVVAIIKLSEEISKSKFIQRRLIKRFKPQIEYRIRNKLKGHLSKLETEYYDEIVDKIIRESPYLRKCNSIIDEKE